MVKKLIIDSYSQHIKKLQIEVEVRENAVTIQIDDEGKISRDIRFDQSGDEFTIMHVGGASPQLLEFGKKKWFFSDSKTFEGLKTRYFR